MFSNIYRPPSAPSEFFDNLKKLVKTIDDENKEMYILGDLNCDMLRKDNEINTPSMTVRDRSLFIPQGGTEEKLGG